MHNPQAPPAGGGSSSGSGSGQAPHYFRVPASNEQDADEYEQQHSRQHSLSPDTEDPLQQALLLNAEPNDSTLPTTTTTTTTSGGGGWESPIRLHCILQSALDLWLNWIFPYVRRMGNLLFGITILTMLIVVPMVTYNSIEQHRFAYAAFDSAGVMVLGTLVLSFRLVYLHLTHWYMPQVQKYVVRIVWMVPLYAVQSWLSLRFRDARIYIDAIRDLYEAFVIASFLYYLIELLGGQDALIRTLLSKTETRPDLGKHSWPLNYLLHDWELGMEFMMQCKHGVLQYVVVKTVATVLTYMFEMIGCYGEGQFQWNTAYPYLAFILNTSVMYALYVLVMLFHAVREELIHPVNWRPLGKFLCVKGVVFFTWWQGVVIFYLKSKDLIKDTGSWSGDEIANALIDYCICTEMVFFAVAHSYTFSYKEYLPSSIPPELRNLEVNATINATANAVAATTSPHQHHPLRLEPQQQQQSSSMSNVSVASASGGSTTTTTTNQYNNGISSNAAYRPPAILDQPMNFKEAFWSSSIPKETLEDIQQLRGVQQIRSGVNSFVRNGNSASKGSISLSEIQSEMAAEEELALAAAAPPPPPSLSASVSDSALVSTVASNSTNNHHNQQPNNIATSRSPSMPEMTEEPTSSDVEQQDRKQGTR